MKVRWLYLHVPDILGRKFHYSQHRFRTRELCTLLYKEIYQARSLACLNRMVNTQDHLIRFLGHFRSVAAPGLAVTEE